MRRVDLAKRLIDAADNRERRLLFSENLQLADLRLANEIRKACYSAWTSRPLKTRGAESAMSCLVEIDSSQEILATKNWVAGIAAITKGKFQEAVSELRAAGEIFARLGRVTDEAETRVAQLMALAMLGHYDEAVEAGQKALEIFVRAGDHLAAGKIEINLSNVVARRDQHAEALKYASRALKRFKKIGERKWQTMTENDLANTYAELNDFDRARRFYRMALEGAITEKMGVTEAEIEASLGNLVRLQGNYADALRYLESSRLRYEQLAMPHQSAIADLEIADIYSELNLAAEAIEIYERVSQTFNRLKMSAEEARSRLNYAGTAAATGKFKTAPRELAKALKILQEERNHTGVTSVMLSSARLAIDLSDMDSAAKHLTAVASAMKRSENPRHHIHYALLKGEVLRKTGRVAQAEKLFSGALELARSHRQPGAGENALNALGEIAVARGESKRAEKYFASAIKIVETQRSELESEFSMAYFGSKLGPFENLTSLLLKENKISKAFAVMESGRSRSLLDSLGKKNRTREKSAKPHERLNELRFELNLLYKRLDSADEDETVKLRSMIADTESTIAGVQRQIKSLAQTNAANAKTAPLSLRVLRQTLGKTGTLIEFVEFDGELSAFVIGNGKMNFVRGLGAATEIRAILEDLQFQFQSMRYGAEFVARFGGELKKRADSSLRRLYDLIMQPLERHLSGRRLVIVPSGVLYYVPFHALRDGTGYIAERFETQYAPSAAIWNALNHRPRGKIRNSLLVGYADERIPLVESEIKQIAGVVPAPRILTGKDARFSDFLSEVSNFDLVHMACHGHFRAENPMFSSLHLADGWVTVRDIVSQRLRARLVTLSACETGLNELFAGDEILGLARGFMAAGAENLIVSLWTVNDEATGRLMHDLYQYLQRGHSIAASLRRAQNGFIERGEHPYLWSPFILMGR